MIDGFDVTDIDSIREQMIAWLTRGRRFAEPMGAEGHDGEERYHGERWRAYVTVGDTVRLQFWTRENSYSIVGKPSKMSADGKSGDLGYLGCVVSARAPRPGEEHTRGADLADGPFTEDTWNAILADIVSYEAMVVFRAAEPAAVG